MRIAMIGTGYVGLVSGACFADFGHDVTCVDKDEKKIAALHRGEIPIYEPGLEELVANNVKAKRLDFTTDLTRPVAEADAVFIAVGTPSRRGDGHADLSYVYAAARELALNGPPTLHPQDFPLVEVMGMQRPKHPPTADQLLVQQHSQLPRPPHPHAPPPPISQRDFLFEG